MPCLPAKWTEFKIHYRYRDTFYHITVRNHGADTSVGRLVLDGAELLDDLIPLVDDGQDHQVEIEMLPSEIAVYQD